MTLHFKVVCGITSKNSFKKSFIQNSWTHDITKNNKTYHIPMLWTQVDIYDFFDVRGYDKNPPNKLKIQQAQNRVPPCDFVQKAWNP
jgi:hypothetical protein